MPSRWYTSILLGTAALCLVLAIMDPNIIIMKPFGPKMCEQLCIQISGCFRYKFKTSDLSCQTKDVTLNQQDMAKGIYVIKATKSQKNMDAGKPRNCNLWEHIFYTRQQNVQCRSIEGSSRHTEAGRQERMTRLLVLHCTKNSRPEQVQQVFLSNNSAAPYPFIETWCGKAAAYIPSLRKLVVANWTPVRLVLAYVDENNETVINRNRAVGAIAVDDRKQLVFMTTRLPSKGLSVMTTEGKNFTSLVTLKCQVEMFAADHKRSVIYVSCPSKKILRFTYKGDAIGHIVVDKHLSHLLSIDHVQDALYYIREINKPRWIQIPFKISLADNTSKQLSFRFFGSSMLTNSNKMYVSPYPFLGVLSVYNVNDKNVQNMTTLTVGFKGREEDKTFICMIP